MDRETLGGHSEKHLELVSSSTKDSQKLDDFKVSMGIIRRTVIESLNMETDPLTQLLKILLVIGIQGIN